MTPVQTVDAYVSERILPEYWPLMARIRGLMAECAPQAAEGYSYAMPVWTIGRIFAYVTAAKTGLTLGFVYGTSLEDRYNLLRGTGKTARHVKLRSLDQFPEPALRDYIAQATALQASRAAASGTADDADR